jgi:hypothetical protein
MGARFETMGSEGGGCDGGTVTVSIGANFDGAVLAGAAGASWLDGAGVAVRATTTGVELAGTALSESGASRRAEGPWGEEAWNLRGCEAGAEPGEIAPHATVGELGG